MGLILKGMAEEIIKLTKEILKKRSLIQGFVKKLQSIALRPQSYAQKKNMIIEEIKVETNKKEQGWYQRVEDLLEQQEELEICELLFSADSEKAEGLPFDQYIDELFATQN